MAQPTLVVLDANGNQVTINTNNPNGQATKANSAPVTLASDQVLVASIDQTTPGSTNRVEVLGTLGTARSIAITTTSANVALTTTTTRVSIVARTCDCRVIIGTTATTSSAYIMAGERMSFTVPASSTIAAIRDAAASSNGTLEITELN